MNAGRWLQAEKKELPSGSRNSNGHQRKDIEFLSWSEETSGIWNEHSEVALSRSLASHWLRLSSWQYDLTNTSHACHEMCCLDNTLGSLSSCCQWARVSLLHAVENSSVFRQGCKDESKAQGGDDSKIQNHMWVPTELNWEHGPVPVSYLIYITHTLRPGSWVRALSICSTWETLEAVGWWMPRNRRHHGGVGWMSLCLSVASDSIGHHHPSMTLASPASFSRVIWAEIHLSATSTLLFFFHLQKTQQKFKWMPNYRLSWRPGATLPRVSG